MTNERLLHWFGFASGFRVRKCRTYGAHRTFRHAFPGLTHPSGKAAGDPGTAWAKFGCRPYGPGAVARSASSFHASLVVGGWGRGAGDAYCLPNFDMVDVADVRVQGANLLEHLGGPDAKFLDANAGQGFPWTYGD
jgi:hypothetical protein